MAKRSSESKELFTTAQVPRDSRVEKAARAYRNAISARLLAAEDEANKKKKVEELVLQWAEEQNVGLTTWQEKKKTMEGYVYSYGDVEARAERPKAWHVRVLLGDEIPEGEGDANAVPDDESEASE